MHNMFLTHRILNIIVDKNSRYTTQDNSHSHKNVINYCSGDVDTIRVIVYTELVRTSIICIVTLHVVLTFNFITVKKNL